MFTAVNPATGESGASYPPMTAAELRQALRTAERAALDWRRTSHTERAGLLRQTGTLLRERADRFAQLMAVEMGKPLADGRREAEKCATVCDYYAENGARLLADELITTDATRSLVHYEPLGAVLAVMPWNFPFWQVFRFVAPSLMAGNVGLLKHAANVPGCGIAIADLLVDAGFPAGVFQNLLIDHTQLRSVIRHKAVRAVTLTGSTAAGRIVARQAGDRLKKTVLELGGSDAYIVLADADIELAVETCVTSRLINAGQSCIAAKRFIVVPEVQGEFERRSVARMAQTRMGDPLDDATDMGPQARIDLRDTLHAQVTSSMARGARCLLGGTIPPGPGAFYPPTVLTDVKKGMAAFDEETFGPVAAIVPVRNEAAAIRAANDSVFGLGAAVFTRDVTRGERIAAEDLAAGSCFVNALVKSDARLPFGGIKDSGYGRELGPHGIREFVNVKTVYVR
ncbi:MAG TPA: NAD-dependent succinate-semialdehyde dehydrogenase [Gemmatimonadales bacterium]|nr:NAD-dependent succinate-semialdehyde dehydrogenase [Gemmatimonadales bacterium]